MARIQPPGWISHRKLSLAGPEMSHFDGFCFVMNGNHVHYWAVSLIDPIDLYVCWYGVIDIHAVLNERDVPWLGLYMHLLFDSQSLDGLFIILYIAYLVSVIVFW